MRNGCAVNSALLPALSEAPTRAKIERLEREMMLMGGHSDYPLRHFFPKDLYARELTLPAGELIVGKVHKRDHIFTLSIGEATIWTETGMQRVCAPFVLASRAGTKRVILAHSEVVCMTVHPNPKNFTDLDQLEAELIEAPALAVPESVEALV